MTRIRSLQPFFERGEIFFLETQRELTEEYLAFPTGMLVDTLDALSYAPQVWGPPSGYEDEIEKEDTYFMEQEVAGMSGITGY